MSLPATKRIANYGNGARLLLASLSRAYSCAAYAAALQVFEPTIYRHYQFTLTDLCDRDPTLEPLFPNNVFAAATFNVGPRTVTRRHRDHLNLAYGPCAITAFGTYNPKTGGHIVLHNLRLIIEFPPMATIIIPSAIVDHSNIGIADGERRYSFTQYSAAGLFRWVDCGYQSKKSMEASGGSLPFSGREYWEIGVGRLSRWKDIQANLNALHTSRQNRGV